jgi:hypothetical protein
VQKIVDVVPYVRSRHDIVPADEPSPAEATRSKSRKGTSQDRIRSTSVGASNPTTTRGRPRGKKDEPEEEDAVEDEEDEEEEYDAPPSLSTRRAKRKPLLRPKSNKSAKKSTTRRHDPTTLEQDSDKGSRRRKRSPSSDSSTIEVAPSRPTAVRLINGTPRNKSRKPAEEDHDRIYSDKNNNPLPSYYEPRGPGDTWTCPYDGCMHQVWDARSEGSLDMIRAHFSKMHRGNAEDLIRRESRPWVSVE